MLRLLLLLLALSQTANAQTAPHWCEDLGFRCMIAFEGRRGGGTYLLNILNSTPVSQFLPPDVAEYVLRCQTIRANTRLNESQRRARLDKEHRRNPLSGALRNLVFVPASQVRGAQLGRGGARIVHDCERRHLQVRADLPPQQQFQLLRKAIQQVRVMRLAELYNPHIIEITAARGTVIAESVLIDTTRSTADPNPRWQSSIWILNSRGVTRARATHLPRAWVSRVCFDRARQGARVHYRHDDTDHLQSLNEYRALLTDYATENERMQNLYETHYEAYSDQWTQFQSYLRSFCQRVSQEQFEQYEAELARTAPNEGLRRMHHYRSQRYSGLCGGMVRPYTQQEQVDLDVDWCRQHICECQRTGLAAALFEHQYYNLDGANRYEELNEQRQELQNLARGAILNLGNRIASEQAGHGETPNSPNPYRRALQESQCTAPMDLMGVREEP